MVRVTVPLALVEIVLHVAHKSGGINAQLERWVLEGLCRFKELFGN